MRYVGNFKEWITPELMHHLETHNGDARPVYQPDRWSTGNPILEDFNAKCKDAYSDRNFVFQQFNSNTADMKNFPLVLPELPEKRKHCHWWIIKLLPGQFQAMHVDPHLLEVDNPVRYSMFLQDFIPGHIFVWDDQIKTNYKKGDVFEWSDPMIVHGPCNISYVPRYTLQVTMHD
jgi:hypothetical protein